MLLGVAAAVIGGTSLFGGRGKPVFALLGGLVIAAIYEGLDLRHGRRHGHLMPAG